MINYTYKIVSTSPEMVIVEYTSENRRTIFVSILSVYFRGENTEEILKKYAPIPQWEQDDLPALTLPEVGATASHTYTYNTSIDTNPIDTKKKELLAKLAEYRWKQVLEGIKYGNDTITTDSSSMANLANLLYNIKNKYIVKADWKCANGTFLIINEVNIEEIYRQAINHIQLCYSAEKFYVNQINDCKTLEELEALDLPC